MDTETFIAIIDTHKKLIYKICYTYCSNRESRKDLQQEILLQLWTSFSKYDGRVKISTWMYRVALNTAISFYRRGKKHAQRHVGISEEVIWLSSEESHIEQDEDVRMLFAFIEKLNEVDKAVILLYMEGQKYREIAEVLGISETNVASKISRIKKLLRTQFENKK